MASSVWARWIKSYAVIGFPNGLKNLHTSQAAHQAGAYLQFL